MTQVVLNCGHLPDSALDAASVFHAEWLPKLAASVADDVESVVIVLNPAEYDHADWRRAAARDLARAHAPKRVNIVGGDGAALAATLAYLEHAPGVTGHYLPLEYLA